ncbi:MAG: hypothetical protein LBH34_00495 [Prevotellaceae bacterium]|jgi:hypothetical protein|nr:hypothetical protein [Prevotellaceae bacterium]
MKKLFSIFSALAILVAIITFSGCKNDEFDGMASPKVMFSTDSVYVDLNLLEKPSVIGVVFSEVGLSSVEFYILKGSVEEPFEEKVTSFFNPHSHSFNYKPVYMEDYTGFKVLATDKAGNQTSSVMEISMLGVIGAPTISFSLEQINVYETQERDAPPFTVTINSVAGLKKVTMYNVINNREELASDTVKTFFPSSHNFVIPSSAISDLEYKIGSKAFKVVAEDIYGKMKIEKLTVSYIELPFPEISIDENILANEGDNIPFAGAIASQGGLTNVKIYVKAGNDSILLKEYNTFTDRHNFSFSETILSATPNMKSIVIYAVDELGKKGYLNHPMEVVELYPGPTLNLTSDTAFLGIDVGQTISFAANVSIPNGIEHVKILAHYYSGRTVETIVSSASEQTTYQINADLLVADDSLVAYSVNIADKRGKTALKVMETTVGYYHFKNVRMTSSSYMNDAPGAFLSATEGRCYTYAEASGVQDKIDLGAYITTSGSTIGAVRLLKPTASDFDSKFNASSWTQKNNTKVSRVTNINFDAVSSPRGINTVNPSSSNTYGQLTDGPNNPGSNVVVFETEGGKKGIIRYVGAESSSVFLISIKVIK